MCLSVIPFPTAVLGRYSTESVAAVFYGIANLLVAFSFLGLRYYAANVGRLFNANIDRRSQRQAITRGLVSPCLYVTGIGLAFIHPYLSWACYLAVPLYFVLPAHFEIRAGEHEVHGANEASTTSLEGESMNRAAIKKFWVMQFVGLLLLIGFASACRR